jgi:hypothetical protein
MIVRPATPGKWADTAQKLTLASARAIKDAGHVGVFRYVGLHWPYPAGSQDIDLIEAQKIVDDVGLELGFVQHVRGLPPDFLWRPADHDGAADAGAAVMAVRAAVGSLNPHVFQDLEAVDGTTGETVGFTLRWGRAIRNSDLHAGLYFGFKVPLTPQQAFDLPDHDRYWSDPAHHEIAVRGVAIHQGRFNVPLMGVTIDEDVVEPDLLGGLPLIVARA